MFKDLVKILSDDLYLFEKEAIERLSIAFNLYKYWIPVDVKDDIKVLVELAKESKSQIEILTARIKMLEESQLIGKVNDVVEDVVKITLDENIKEPIVVVDDVNELVEDVQEIIEDAVEDVQEIIEDAVEDVQEIIEDVVEDVQENIEKKRWNIKKCFLL